MKKIFLFKLQGKLQAEQLIQAGQWIVAFLQCLPDQIKGGIAIFPADPTLLMAAAYKMIEFTSNFEFAFALPDGTLVAAWAEGAYIIDELPEGIEEIEVDLSKDPCTFAQHYPV